MNNLQWLIVNGRKQKQFSQRELARRIGISNTSLNDLENGKVQKPDVETLRKISEELDISIMKLLIMSGYDKLIKLLTREVRENE